MPYDLGHIWLNESDVNEQNCTIIKSSDYMNEQILNDTLFIFLNNISLMHCPESIAAAISYS